MKTLFIHHTSDFNGGSDKSLFEFVINLNLKEITPLICLRHGDPYIQKYKEYGIEVKTMSITSPPKRLFSKQGVKFILGFLPSIAFLTLLIIRRKIDVVHVNTSINIQGGISAYLSRRPIVWHVRELLGSSLLDKAVKSLVLHLATKVVAISKSVSDSLNSNKVELVYNGMDLNDYKSVALSEKKPLVVNCVGRIEEWKGQHIAIDAISQLGDEFKDVIFQFVGSGAVNKPEYLTGLKSEVEQKKLVNVSFLGSRKDVPAILRNSQILIAPTCTSEPFGRTVIEGMAAGNIVISTNAGGPKEIIDEGVNGYLVAPNSSKELAEKLAYVISNYHNLKNIRETAMSCVNKQYRIERVSENMTKIFQEVLV